MLMYRTILKISSIKENWVAVCLLLVSLFYIWCKKVRIDKNKDLNLRFRSSKLQKSIIICTKINISYALAAVEVP